MPLGGDDPEFTPGPRMMPLPPVISVLAAYGLDDEASYAPRVEEFWSAMHGFVLLEMTGAMSGHRRYGRRVHRHGDEARDRHAEALSFRIA